MMDRKLVTVTFSVEEEFVPGMFHDPLDFGTTVANDALYRLQSYKPEIENIRVENIEPDMLSDHFNMQEFFEQRKVETELEKKLSD